MNCYILYLIFFSLEIEFIFNRKNILGKTSRNIKNTGKELCVTRGCNFMCVKDNHTSTGITERVVLLSMENLLIFFLNL